MKTEYTLKELCSILHITENDIRSTQTYFKGEDKDNFSSFCGGLKPASRELALSIAKRLQYGNNIMGASWKVKRNLEGINLDELL